MSRNMGAFLVVLVIILVGVLAFMMGQRTPSSVLIVPTPTPVVEVVPTEEEVVTPTADPRVTNAMEKETTPAPSKAATPTP